MGKADVVFVLISSSVLAERATLRAVTWCFEASMEWCGSKIVEWNPVTTTAIVDIEYLLRAARLVETR